MEISESCVGFDPESPLRGHDVGGIFRSCDRAVGARQSLGAAPILAPEGL